MTCFAWSFFFPVLVGFSSTSGDEVGSWVRKEGQLVVFFFGNSSIGLSQGGLPPLLSCLLGLLLKASFHSFPITYPCFPLLSARLSSIKWRSEMSFVCRLNLGKIGWPFAAVGGGRSARQC